MKQGQTKGSFGIPEDMQEAIRKSKEKAGSSQESEHKAKPEPKSKSNYKDSESIPEEAEMKAAEEDSKEKQKKEEAEIAEEIKKDLGIEFDEDDLWAFYFKNNLEKRNIVIVPGKVMATFRTIAMKENDTINDVLAEAVEKGSLLEAGMQNIRVKHTLAFGLRELGKPGKLKSLGENYEERLEALQEMNTMMIDKLMKKWNKFIWLLEYTVNQEMQVKNS